MASKKRKTLQIKRPDVNKPASKKKTLPKVDVDDASATSSIDFDELSSGTPKTAKLQQPNENKPVGKATRISLPDEEKIRKARRANVTQDLDKEDALPNAEQIMQAEKSATLPIMIDTEDVEDTDSPALEEAASVDQSSEQTMQIDPAALATGDVGNELADADAGEEPTSDQTMQIDPAALVTGDVGSALADAEGEAGGSDQTMKIDPESLVTGDVGAALADAENGVPEGSDQTMQIDTSSLITGDLTSELADEDVKEEAPSSEAAAKMAQDTMQMDPSDFDPPKAADPDAGRKMAMETMHMDASEFAEKDDLNETMNLSQPTAGVGSAPTLNDTMNLAQPSAQAEEDPDLTKEQMEESFNAMTMEMDAATLQEAMKELQAKQANDEDSLNKNMDLTEDRPKTIMIKRPSREAGSMTPTVKAVRPDVATVRTARPVTANTAQPKEGTSRIDVPEGEGTTQEGKTIKLRRPSGSGAGASTVNRVAAGAGLTIAADGTYIAGPKKEATLGGGWLAVAILTFLVSLGAIWSVVAIEQVELPMPGRMVGPANNILPAPTNP